MREDRLISLYDFAASRQVASDATWLSERLLRAYVPVSRSYQVDRREADPMTRRYIDHFMYRRGDPRVQGFPAGVDVHTFDVAPIPLVDLVGIYGAGVATDGEHEFPAIFVDDEVHIAGMVPFDELHDLDELVKVIVGDDVPASTLFVGIPPPEPHFGPADGAACAGNSGTLGALVTTNQGRLGILTAGHVANIKNMNAHSNGTLVGSVVLTMSPLTSAPGLPSADVALIEVDSASIASATEFSTTFAPPVSISGSVSARAGQRLVMYSPRGRRAEGILAIAAWISSPRLVGMWEEIYMTLAPISIQGDSGAPVLLEGTSSIVGHVVGGSPGFTTYIQAIDPQLLASQSTLRQRP